MSEQPENGPIIIPADAGYVRNALLKHLGKQLEKSVRGGWKGEAHLSLVEEGDEMGFMLRVFPEGSESPINSSGDIPSVELTSVMRLFKQHAVISGKPETCVEQWVAANACIKLLPLIKEINSRLINSQTDEKVLKGQKYLTLSGQGIDFVVRDLDTGKTIFRNTVSTEKFPKDVVLSYNDESDGGRLNWMDGGLPPEVAKLLEAAGAKTSQDRVNTALVSANISSDAMEIIHQLLEDGPVIVGAINEVIRDKGLAELREFDLIVDAVNGLGEKYVGATEKAIEVFKFAHGDNATFESACKQRADWDTSQRHRNEALQIGPEFLDVLMRFLSDDVEEVPFPTGWKGQTEVKGRVHYDTDAMVGSRSGQYLLAHRLMTIQTLNGAIYGYGIGGKKAIFLTEAGVALLKFVCGKSLSLKQAKQWSKSMFGR